MAFFCAAPGFDIISRVFFCVFFFFFFFPIRFETLDTDFHWPLLLGTQTGRQKDLLQDPSESPTQRVHEFPDQPRSWGSSIDSHLLDKLAHTHF